jgi:hypothetical protein
MHTAVSFYFVPTESNALYLAIELGDILSLYQLYPVCITQKIGVKKELVLCENHDALELGLTGVNGDAVYKVGYGLAKINLRPLVMAVLMHYVKNMGF